MASLTRNFATLIGVLNVAAALGVGCGPASRAASEPPLPVEAVTPPTTEPAPPNPFATAAREVLATHCGSCHRPDLPTSDPRALKVFDLDRMTWYDHLTRSQLGAMGRRVQGSSALTAPEREAVERFIGCARDGACG